MTTHLLARSFGSIPFGFPGLGMPFGSLVLSFSDSW